MIKTYTKFLIFTFLLSFCLHVQAEITSLSSAINKSGRQRMLSQRILKTYSMIGIDVNAMSAQQQLKDAVSLFDEQLDELIAYAPDKNIKKELDRVSLLWDPYKAAVIEPVDRNKALELLDTSAELLLACHKVVLMLTDLSTGSAGQLVNISGRQRMLSQRMSMLYMYQTWGFQSPEISSQMSQDINEFKVALTELTAAKENTATLQKQLRRAASEWKLFKHGLDSIEKRPVPYIVNLAGDKLLKRMNDITALYTNLKQE